MADWTCTKCGWVNRDFSAECLSCGAPHEAADGAAEPLGESATAQPDGPKPWDLAAGAVAPGPELVINEPLPYVAPPPTPWFRTDGLLGGLVAATIATVLATAIWYAVVAFSSFQIGFVAAAVGWVIGSGALLGSRNRGSVWLAAASVVLTILALGVSEYLISYHAATQELGIQIDLIQPLDFMLNVIINSLSADPVTLAFWGFAVVLAGYVVIKAVMTPELPQEPTTAGPVT